MKWCGPSRLRSVPTNLIESALRPFLRCSVTSNRAAREGNYGATTLGIQVDLGYGNILAGEFEVYPLCMELAWQTATRPRLIR